MTMGYSWEADRENATQAQALEARVAQSEANLQDDRETRGHLPLLGMHRFTDADFEAMLGMWSMPKYSEAALRARGAATHAAPRKPPPYMIELLTTAPVGPPPQLRPRVVAPWLKLICNHREVVRGLAVGTSDEEGRV